MGGGGGGGELLSQEVMIAERIPLGCRDMCANLLLPLNKCRIAEYWLPWKCVQERHAYEKCEYELFLERFNKMTKLREGNLSEPQLAG